MKPRVALNGRYTGVVEPTGVQTVAHAIFAHIVRSERSFDLVIFADRNAPDMHSWARRDDVELVHVPFRSWGRARSQLFEQALLTRHARSRGARLVFHPINTCPRFGRGLAHVVTLHDLNFLHFPTWYGRAFRTWLGWTAIPGLRKAARIVCISDWVAKDAQRTLGIDAGRITRIYNGLRDLGNEPDAVRDPNVVLAVNPFQPHKNLVRLIDAVGQLREIRSGLVLRVAGRPHENFRRDPDLADRLDRDYVQVTGYLTDTQLAVEYRKAAVLCMPSFSEGFGMPLIEAMARDTTVVTSDASCLPEIAGEAGILVDPAAVDSIARGLRLALEESDTERAQRHASGRSQAAKFDWERAAADYVGVFEELLESQAP